MGHLTLAPPGVLLTGSDRSSILEALDAGTGRVLWSHDLRGSVWRAPAVNGTTLYVAPNDQALWALRVDTGEVVWWHRPLHLAPGGFQDSLSTPRLIRTSPVITDGRLVVVSTRGDVGVLKPDGTPLTQTHLLAPLERDQVWAQPVAAGGHLLVVSLRGRQFDLDLTTLESRRADLKGARRGVQADPLVQGEYLVAVTAAGQVYGRPLSPTVRGWLRNLPGPTSRPVAGPDQRFFLATATRLWCLSTQTGATVWSRPVACALDAAPAYAADTEVVVATRDGHMLRLAADSGAELDRLPMRGPPCAGPVLWNGRAIYGFADGTIGAYPAGVPGGTPAPTPE